jgi:hypothetical protein
VGIDRLPERVDPSKAIIFFSSSERENEWMANREACRQESVLSVSLSQELSPVIWRKYIPPCFLQKRADKCLGTKGTEHVLSHWNNMVTDLFVSSVDESSDNRELYKYAIVM